jgi:hypothetical protein
VIRNVLTDLFDKYFVTIWDYIGEAIIADYLKFFHLEHLLGSRNGFDRGEVGMAFRNKEQCDIILEWCRKHHTSAPERIAHMMPLSINENGVIKWHPFSKAIIDEFGDNENVLSELSSNMGTFGTVGSRIPYFSTQKILLDELHDHKIQRVKEWTIEMLDYTERKIKRERLEDEELMLL